MNPKRPIRPGSSFRVRPLYSGRIFSLHPDASRRSIGGESWRSRRIKARDSCGDSDAATRGAQLQLQDTWPRWGRVRAGATRRSAYADGGDGYGQQKYHCPIRQVHRLHPILYRGRRTTHSHIIGLAVLLTSNRLGSHPDGDWRMVENSVCRLVTRAMKCWWSGELLFQYA